MDGGGVIGELLAGHTKGYKEKKNAERRRNEERDR